VQHYDRLKANICQHDISRPTFNSGYFVEVVQESELVWTIKYCDFDVNAVDDRGYSVLHKAIQDGKLELLKALLSAENFEADSLFITFDEN